MVRLKLRPAAGFLRIGALPANPCPVLTISENTKRI